MADELELGSEVEEVEERKENKRIKDLSEKVKLTSEERDELRDELKKQTEQKEVEKAELTRERDFYAGFADVVSSNPAAKDHKDDILAKVKSGYTVEDATFAVLGKAGKLGQPKPEPRPNPAGGSAINQPVAGSQKTAAEMTQAERRAELVAAESRGDLGLS